MDVSEVNTIIFRVLFHRLHRSRSDRPACEKVRRILCTNRKKRTPEGSVMEWNAIADLAK